MDVVGLLAFCCTLLVSPVFAVWSEFGRYSYVEYQPGTINIVISSPHGGYKTPGEIPDRHAGCYDEATGSCTYEMYDCYYPDETKCGVGLRRDSYTQEITLILADEIEVLTGERPHVVINHLHRRKLDPNRAEEEAAQGNWNSVIAYGEYHRFINKAKDSFGGYGIYFDIHGQSHPEAFIELGYDVTTSELNDGDYTVSDATIKSLGLRKCGDDNECFKNLIYGDTSFGAYLQQEGYKTVPSPQHKSPGTSPYYNGGYSVETHGSKFHGGDVDSIQIELPFRLRNQDEGPQTASDLAQAIVNFYNEHYQ